MSACAIPFSTAAMGVRISSMKALFLLSEEGQDEDRAEQGRFSSSQPSLPLHTATVDVHVVPENSKRCVAASPVLSTEHGAGPLGGWRSSINARSASLGARDSHHSESLRPPTRTVTPDSVPGRAQLTGYRVSG
eukprot:415962-Hanusia_phi.AAC.2